MFCCGCTRDITDVEAFRLEAAEFLKGAVEGALRGGAGAVDGSLQAIEFFVRQIFRRIRFEIGAAAEAPGRVDDFASEGLFERRVGREFGEIAGLEFIKYVPLFGTDEIRHRKETKFRRILGYTGFTRGRDRAMGPFGILPIGEDLSGGSHLKTRV